MTGTINGEGKAQEVRDLVRGTGADTVILDEELSPAQLRNLEELFGCKVLDRTAVTLAATQAGHLGAEKANAGFNVKPKEATGSIMPSKNTVVLEDELMKAGEVRRSFELNTAIVKAFHSMMTMVVKS